MRWMMAGSDDLRNESVNSLMRNTNLPFEFSPQLRNESETDSTCNCTKPGLDFQRRLGQSQRPVNCERSNDTRDRQGTITLFGWRQITLFSTHLRCRLVSRRGRNMPGHCLDSRTQVCQQRPDKPAAILNRKPLKKGVSRDGKPLPRQSTTSPTKES